MRKLIIFAVLGAWSITANAETAVYHTTWEALYDKEKAGARYYKKGKYRKAYEALILPAQAGLKDAQYFIGFMYLKGHHVPQSLEVGMAWLGVANEIEVKEWREPFDLIYHQVSTEQQEQIDARVAEFIEMYGMRMQKIECNRNPRAGSRKIRINCMKLSNAKTPLYDVETQTGK